jgi:hypothetical protein
MVTPLARAVGPPGEEANHPVAPTRVQRLNVTQVVIHDAHTAVFIAFASSR